MTSSIGVRSGFALVALVLCNVACSAPAPGSPPSDAAASDQSALSDVATPDVGRDDVSTASDSSDDARLEDAPGDASQPDVIVSPDTGSDIGADIGADTGADTGADVGQTDVGVDVGDPGSPDVPTDVGMALIDRGCPTAQTSCGGACVDTQSDPLHCGACGSACGAEQTCVGGACACSSGRSICPPTGGATSTCVDLTSDNNHCGSCGVVCSAGRLCGAGGCQASCGGTTPTLCGSGDASYCANLVTDRANCGACATRCADNADCAAGACAPHNDTAATAIALDATVPGAMQTTTGTLVGATSGSGRCAATSSEVYYSVTVSQRSLLYVDTFGSTANTAIGTRSAATSPTANCTNDSCATQQEQLAVVVEPGTTLIEVALAGGSAGPFTLRWSVTPTGGGVIRAIAPTTTVQTFLGNSLPGSTPAPSAYAPSCAPSGVASGAEDAYYFLTCPSDSARSLHVSTCGSAYDTVVEVRSPGRPPSCNDNVGFDCGAASSVNHALPAGAGAHVVVVDSASAAAAGRYRLYFVLDGCTNAYVRCDGACRLVSSFAADPMNCGRCGLSCSAGETCTAATCSATPPGFFLTRSSDVVSAVMEGSAGSTLGHPSCPSPQFRSGIFPTVDNTMGTGGVLVRDNSTICSLLSLANPSPPILTMSVRSQRPTCPSGYAWTGVRGRTSPGLIHQLSLRCSRMEVTGSGPYSVEANPSAEMFTTVFGGDGGSPFAPVDCPPGAVVVGAGIAGPAPEGYRLRCQVIRAFRAVLDATATVTRPLVPAGNSSPTVFIDDCPPGQMVSGVRALTSTAGVAQLSVLCGAMQAGSAPLWSLIVGNESPLPLRGFATWTTDRNANCSAATNGLIFYLSGGTIMGIRPSCATGRVYDTGVAGLAGFNTSGPLVGTATTSVGSAACAVGSVVTGLEIRVAGGIQQVGVRCTPLTIR